MNPIPGGIILLENKKGAQYPARKDNRIVYVPLNTVFDNRNEESKTGYAVFKFPDESCNKTLFFKNRDEGLVLAVDEFTKLLADRGICSFTDINGEKKDFYINHLGQVLFISDKVKKNLISWNDNLKYNFKERMDDNKKSQQLKVDVIKEQLANNIWD